MVAQMDHAELLKLQFSCCRDFLTTSSLFPGSCSPAQWIRLQALALQVTSGPCAFEAPSAEEAEARTLWRSWKQLGSMSIEEAQELFVRQVLQHCESLEHEFEVLTFFREFGSLATAAKAHGKQTEKNAATASSSSNSGVNTSASDSNSMANMNGMMRRHLRTMDLKATLGALTEEMNELGANSREDMRHMSLAIHADVTIEERTMEARDQRANVEELGHDVQLIIKQLDSDIDAALSRRKWSYEQIETQCEELLARCETTANTYTNQLSLTSSSIAGIGKTSSGSNRNDGGNGTGTNISALKVLGIVSSSLLIPIGAGVSYFLFKGIKGRLR